MMKIRDQVVRTLLRVEKEGAFSNLETKKILEKGNYKEEDRGLYLNIVYGTLQNKIYLDFLLKKYIKTDLNKLDSEVLCILRSSVYQIYFLNKIPDYAVVNEAVSLIEGLNPKAKGFVNGVLRNILRGQEEDKIFDFDSFDNEKEALSVRYSIPVWIIHKYYEAFGSEVAEKVIPLLNEKPPFTIRTNTLKTNREALKQALENKEIKVDCGALDKDALKLENANHFENQVQNDELFKKGHFVIQDQGAMLAASMLEPKPDEMILDMCAAPGGKTTHISQLMENRGTVVACDVFESRLKLIDEAAQRLGITNIMTQKSDGCIFRPEEKEKYDRILLDAPCSGLGIIRRKPEIRYTMTKKARKELVKIQKTLLDHAAQYLKPEGTLVYCTCTVNGDENEKQIQTFLDRHPYMHLEKSIDALEMVRTNPLDDGCDCFFMCKLKKKCQSN